MNFKKLLFNSSVVVMTSLLAFVPSNSHAKDLKNVKIDQKTDQTENKENEFKNYWIKDDTDLFEKNNELSKEILELEQGDVVKARKNSNGFFEVIKEDNDKKIKGFVKESYISDKKVEKDPKKFEGWTNSEAKVVEVKSEDTEKLGTLDKDIEIKGHLDGEYLRFNYFGRTAYTSLDNTTKESPESRDARLSRERKAMQKAKAEKEAKRRREERKRAEENSNESYSGRVSGRTITMSSTAYTADPRENGGYSVTAMGTPIRQGVVAVDPNVIPLGTRLYIEGYGYARAEDTGGAIKGHRIDLAFGSASASNNWGRRTVRVTILN